MHRFHQKWALQRTISWNIISMYLIANQNRVQHHPFVLISHCALITIHLYVHETKPPISLQGLQRCTGLSKRIAHTKPTLFLPNFLVDCCKSKFIQKVEHFSQCHCYWPHSISIANAISNAIRLQVQNIAFGSFWKQLRVVVTLGCSFLFVFQRNSSNLAVEI